MSHLKRKFKTYYVDLNEDRTKIDQKDNEKDQRKIWTLEMIPDSEIKPPLVLIHGFNLALGVWILNLDELSENRKVYAIDMLGFGRSSRPKFKKRENPELDLVDSIEEWRKNVGLDQKFVLLGHSFGAYISACYVMKYGTNLIDRLILNEPWGFSDKADLIEKVPFLVKWVVKLMFITNINPMAHLRISGPLGKQFISHRDYIKKKFEVKLGEKDSNEILIYFYQCCAGKASGELVFKRLCTSELTAKKPLISRANEMPSKLRLTFVFGKDSWIYREKEDDIKKIFPNNEIDYKIIEGSGHHTNTDQPNLFNSYINSL